MNFKNLVIERQESYSDVLQPLKGKVQLAGDRGKMEVVLSSATVSKVLALVMDDVDGVAKGNAQLAKVAVDEASNEVMLLEDSLDETKLLD